MGIRELLDVLCEAADAPKKTIYASREKTGKRIVGWVAPYAPEELIYASGCLPVGLWGGETSILRARTYLPPFACSIMQSIMEYENDGTYDILSAVLIPAHCDTLKCFGQKWKGACPAIPFVYPQNRGTDSAMDFLVSEYALIRKKLEEILQTKITDAALSEAIILYNEYRAVMRDFTHTAARYPEWITPTVRHRIIKAAYFMDKAEYTPMIRKLTALLKLQKPKDWSGKRVVVTGLTLEPMPLLEIFEQFNLSVCADDLAQESRQFRTDVPFCGDPMRSLAKQWQNHSGCSLAFDPEKRRIEQVLHLAKSQDADGIVIALMKFCDPEEYDVPIILDEAKRAGIPVLTIEIDQQATSFEPTRTRLQSFSESMI
ncbi:MAG: 2-hydroxyacyl-CoA dehydratase family protein [Ndongobacter sp.]|nr:2-hydroxyacyl-CoA dehydratase family protein [Ndongobacter sp.]